MENQIEVERKYNLTDAAKALGISLQVASLWKRGGVLKGFQDGGEGRSYWRVTGQELLTFQRPKLGRRPKSVTVNQTD